MLIQVISEPSFPKYQGAMKQTPTNQQQPVRPVRLQFRLLVWVSNRFLVQLDKFAENGEIANFLPY